MSEYKIELNVPIPPPGRRSGAFTDALRALPVGGMIRCERTNSKQSTICNTAKRLGYKLIQRRLPGGQMGVWRTA